MTVLMGQSPATPRITSYTNYQCTWKPNHGISCCKGSWPLFMPPLTSECPANPRRWLRCPPLADQHRRYLYAGPSFGHFTPRDSREGSFSLIAATLKPSIMPMLTTLQHALHARSTRACMRILDTPSSNPLDRVYMTRLPGRVAIRVLGF